MGELNIEAVGPKNPQNTVFRTDTKILMRDVALLKPSRPAGEKFAFVFAFEIVPETP